MTYEESSAEEPSKRDVEDLYHEFIRRSEGGEELDIDGFCLAHPEHEGALRRRHRHWILAGRALVNAEIEPGHSEPQTKNRSLLGGGLRPPKQATYEARYSVGDEIGRGGMGSILSVRDEHLDRELAMKMLRVRTLDTRDGSGPVTPPHDLARFLEEARITGGLQHPNIVPVHELGADPDGKPYFTMKLVEGRTFREVLPLARAGKEGWNIERALGVLLKVCQAVGYAHDKDVIHRDLKPANLMVGSFGEVYVMDWGLARDCSRGEFLLPEGVERDALEDGDSGSFRTRDGTVLGTPEYMAPEQAAGNREEVGPLSDVYSVGAMLYELLTGQTPKGDGRRPLIVRVMAAVGSVPKEVRLIAPEAPAELCAICERAIEQDPKDRYPGIVELADDLEAYLEGRVVKAYATGAFAEFRKWIQRNPAVALLAGTVISLVVIGLVVISGLALRVSDQKKSLETSKEELARSNEDLKIKTLEATENAALEKNRADEVLRLSLAQDYEDLVVEANNLWPAHPEMIGDLEGWISKASSLVAELPALVEKRDQLRSMANPQGEEELATQRRLHPEYEDLVSLQGELAFKRSALEVRRGDSALELPTVNFLEYPSGARALMALAFEMFRPGRKVHGQEALGLVLASQAAELASPELRSEFLDYLAWAHLEVGDTEGALDRGYTALEAALDGRQESAEARYGELELAVEEATSADGIARAQEEVVELEASVAALASRVDRRTVWTFPETEAQGTSARWWHNQLSILIEELESLNRPGTGLLVLNGVSEEGGWSVSSRLQLALDLQEGFSPGGKYASRWEEDLPAIRGAYPGLEITPQMGLVPIGQDPISGLWEFWDIQTGSEPQRDEQGVIQVEVSSGLVLVLIPGGKCWMGAQSNNPAGHNYDRNADTGERPVREIELTAFFLSKYEMTQGQWKRLTGWNRSSYGPDGDWGGDWAHDGAIGNLLHPVTDVSWTDCEEVMTRCGLMLPSEAQWEYSCRAGSETIFWSGDTMEDLLGIANLEDRYAQNHGAPSAWKVEESFDDGYTAHCPVDIFRANKFGLHHIHGNVSEWCRDSFEQGFYFEPVSINPVNVASGDVPCIFRGGSFSHAAGLARSAFSISRPRAFIASYLGLRPARGVVTVE
jgi:serine/threonine protein kinase/formylglycine-generating enzyme required for sulfatase activity